MKIYQTTVITESYAYEENELFNELEENYNSYTNEYGGLVVFPEINIELIQSSAPSGVIDNTGHEICIDQYAITFTSPDNEELDIEMLDIMTMNLSKVLD